MLSMTKALFLLAGGGGGGVWDGEGESHAKQYCYR